MRSWSRCSLRPYLLLPLFLLPYFVHGQAITAGCGTAGKEYTISSQADATAIAGCKVYSGSVAVATSVAEPINLDGIEEIMGRLSVGDGSGDCSLTSFASGTLRRVGKLFALWGTPNLTTLDFKSLTEVGEIAWTGLSAFTTISTDAGISSTGAVTISGTSLSTLQGINLKDVGSVDIRSNPNLLNITLPLGNLQGSINIQENGEALIVSLPNLVSAGALSVIDQNLSSLHSPSLNFLSQIMFMNVQLEVLIVDALSIIRGDTTLFNVTNLVNISMRGLLSVTEFLIVGSPDLGSLDFDALGRANNIYVDVNITNVNMPRLTSMSGNLTLNSAYPLFNCTPFDA